MRQVILLFIALLMFTSCSTLKVSVDYDDSFDFSKQNSFMVKHKSKEGDDTLTNDRIINALELELKLKNYKKTSEGEADLIFVFHTSVKNKSDIQTDYQTMGFGRYRYGGAMVSTTSTYNYTEGTIIVDALNPQNQKIVWRAIGTLEVKEKNTPKERTEYINGIVKKLMSSFPK